ncbi:MAG: hypothetical protein FWF85_06660, partial [Clostridiales bacterium]|nr:hypothetical protein [Clostridiales bacterium]
LFDQQMLQTIYFSFVLHFSFMQQPRYYAENSLLTSWNTKRFFDPGNDTDYDAGGKIACGS